MTKGIEPIELLRELGKHYRHVVGAHASQSANSSVRHTLDARMEALASAFERVLGEWVTEDALRTRWRDFFYHDGTAPREPHLAPPPLFKGRTDAGAMIEIRSAGDGYDLFVDGARADHSVAIWHAAASVRDPVQIGDHRCIEAFEAPREATDALADYLAGAAPTPWQHARVLVEDGLIDTDFSLTSRGQRCMRKMRLVRVASPRVHGYCVLVADAARARVLVLDVDRDQIGPEISELVETASLAEPSLRARAGEEVSDSRNGRRGGASTPIHATPDRRDHRRREHERRFAVAIAEQAAHSWRRFGACDLVVAASPVMLGLLRSEVEQRIGAKDRVDVYELASDYTKLSASQLHDQLAELELLPPRRRRDPIRIPGLPTEVWLG